MALAQSEERLVVAMNNCSLMVRGVVCVRVCLFVCVCVCVLCAEGEGEGGVL